MTEEIAPFLIAQLEVAQVSNLLYRRFPIGRTPDNLDANKHAKDLQAGSPALQQVGNLRYNSGHGEAVGREAALPEAAAQRGAGH